MIYELSEHYFVRSLAVSDLAGSYPSWFEDQEVSRYNSHGKLFKTREYFEEYVRSLNSEDRVVWAICHRIDGHIGNIALQSVSWIDRNAEFAILLGDRRHWGTGVATLAGIRLLHHGFRKLNLERVYCATAATNTGMQKLAVRLGMKEEGRRRRHLFLEGEWVDTVEYGVLRDETGFQPAAETT